MKKILLALALLPFFVLNAANAKYQSEDISLNVIYNDTITPGDAIFARMIMSSKSNKKFKSEEKKASLQLIQNDKVIEQAPFYLTGKKKNQQQVEMLCGIPVSLWLTENQFTLKIVIMANGKQMDFVLSSTFVNREFNKEVLDLDEKNTSIKTNLSPERTAQIEKLNAILFTTNPANIYSFKKFICPTATPRYTAYCGDRRVYKYVNGKSSTSLHYGNDYGIPEGSEVRACAEGKVVMAENRISTGWSIVIEHLPGLYSLYYHLSSLNVKEGEYVKQGELIGKSGSTGLATGPHLHWEIRLNASAVCPEFFMNDFCFEEN